ncbi:integrator complex subunit 6 homolog [Capsicum annuum]|uniref:integrator complex subunit 6 homolog n=1 Tax=Capsicum annuum TaxID=4072 RepID=UPI001FB0D6C1|nr:integrator complex subunit 6 homolog [Capsicum annuum]
MESFSSSSSSSSSSSTDSIPNPFTALILHPNITLPPLIPPSLSHKFTNFAVFKNFPNLFAQISSPSLSSSKPFLPSSIPLQIIKDDDNPSDRDNLSIAELNPKRSTSNLLRKPSSIPATVHNTAPPEPFPNVAIPYTLLRSVRKIKTIMAKVPKLSLPIKSSSKPTQKAFSSLKFPSNVQGSSSSKVSPPKPSTCLKNQVTLPVPSDSSNSDFTPDTTNELAPEFEVPYSSSHQDTSELIILTLKSRN